MERETFDNYYDGFLGGRVFRWLDWSKVRILRRVLGELPDGARVVDLGCGSAGISTRLARMFPAIEITGVDHDAQLLEMAKARGLQVKQVDFDKPLPFDEGHFDVVLMIDTIEHVESREKTIREVKRILGSTGTLVVFTPPYDTLPWLLGEKFHHLITRRRSDHISPFTSESLSWLLENNFEQYTVKNTNFGLTMCGIAQRKKA